MNRPLLLTLALVFLSGNLIAQSDSPPTGKTFLEGTWQADLGFSPGVITRGGDTIWLAGTTGHIDENGQPITGFEAQTRQVYRNIDASLRQLGSNLSDVVTVSVFLGDARHVEQLIEIRKEIFPEGRYPSSILITNASFALPEIMVEIKATAVVDR